MSVQQHQANNSVRLQPKLISALCAAALLSLSPNIQAAVTNFSTDVSSSIDKGLIWQDANGAYTGSAGEATGLSLLALLEKRQGADPNALSQGYAAASAADKARMDSAVAYILASIVPRGYFYAYGDGAAMMALSVYLLTGGPNPAVPAAINTLFDRTIASQGGHGYWCYTDGSCLDSSTSQLVMAGLASVRSVYSSVAHADPVRLASLNTAATNAKNAYVANGLAGESCSAGGILTATERGHGYNVGSCNSPQQTASGTWIQLVGGSNLNDASIQGYLEWLRNRYRYTSTSPADNDGWPSYWYYLWSSSKAYSFIEDSGVSPNPGNLSPASIGTLAPGAAPAFAARQVHLDCSLIPRVALFGAGGNGYYCDPNEPQRVYFDYAYTIMTHQLADGMYVDHSGTSRWNNYSAQAYALLVLQRSVGGGCVDTDGDGKCDSEDNCPATPNPNQEDADGDGVGDACDNCVNVSNPGQEDTNGNGIGDACEGKCNVDNDGDIDKNDLSLISRNRNKTVPPLNPAFDANNDGKVTPADVKVCIPLCTRSNCATQ